LEGSPAAIKPKIHSGVNSQWSKTAEDIRQQSLASSCVSEPNYIITRITKKKSRQLSYILVYYNTP